MQEHRNTCLPNLMAEDYELQLSQYDFFFNLSSSQDLEPDQNCFHVLLSTESQASTLSSTALKTSGREENINQTFDLQSNSQAYLVDYLMDNTKGISTQCYWTNEMIEEKEGQIYINGGENGHRGEDKGGNGNESDSDNDEQSSPQRRRTERTDDSNNACKKFITCLWKKCLKSQDKKKIQKKLQEFNRSQTVDPKKGSRYGFACYLINIKELLGQPALLQSYQKFRACDFSNMFDFKNEESREYFLKLVPKYKMAFQEMIKGEIKGCLEIIYSSQEFRQEAYKKKGIKCTFNYQEKIKRLIDQENMKK